MPSYLERLNQALHGAMAADESVLVVGEDVADPYGGAFRVTRGLSSAYPDRVITSPISEGAMVGLAGGLALQGLRPVVEVMFGDFVLLGADQLVNHLAKYRAMWGVRELPVVIRTPMGGGRGYGPTHSQSLEKHLFGVPGLKVVAPSLLHDPGALLQEVIRGPDPALFIEHKRLYPAQLTWGGICPHLTWDGDSRFPTAVLTNQPGPEWDVVIFTYGGGTLGLDTFLRELDKEEVGIAAVVPSLLNGLDAKLLASYAMRARAGCIVLEEGTAGFGWGAEVLSLLHETLGTRTPPVCRLASAPTVLPACRELEAVVITDFARVLEAVLRLCAQSLRRRP